MKETKKEAVPVYGHFKKQSSSKFGNKVKKFAIGAVLCLSTILMMCGLVACSNNTAPTPTPPTPTPEIVQLASPEVIAGLNNITFRDVANAQSYRVEIDKDNDGTIENTVTVNKNQAVEGVYTQEIGTEAGVYGVSVVAKGDGVAYSDSNPSETVVTIKQQLAEPEIFMNYNVENETNDLVIKKVDDALSYKITFTGNGLETPHVVEFTPDKFNFMGVYRYALQLITGLENGNVNIVVDAIGGEDYVNSSSNLDFNYQGVVSEIVKLNAPELLYQNKIVSWDNVNGSVGYNVTVNGAKTQAVYNAETGKYEISLENVPYGFYDIAVIALGDGKATGDSDAATKSIEISAPVQDQATYAEVIAAIKPKLVDFLYEKTFVKFDEATINIKGFNMKDGNLYYTFGPNNTIAYSQIGSGCEGADMNSVLKYINDNEFSIHTTVWGNIDQKLQTTLINTVFEKGTVEGLKGYTTSDIDWAMATKFITRSGYLISRIFMTIDGKMIQFDVGVISGGTRDEVIIKDYQKGMTSKTDNYSEKPAIWLEDSTNAAVYDLGPSM